MSSNRNKFKAYSKATHTVSKTRQVVMLYDGVIRFLQQAREAMEAKNIERRYNLLVKASNVILGLQSCLDFTQDRAIAQTLYDFYSSADARILSMHRTNDVKLCDHLISELKELRNIWATVDNGAPENEEKSIDSSPAVAEEAPVIETQAQTQDATHPLNPLAGVAVSA